MTVQEEIDDLLKAHGAVLDRTKKHHVWKFPDGRTFVAASSASDVRAERNQLATLRQMLGVKRVVRKNPGRLEKKGVGHAAYAGAIPVRPDWKQVLMAAIGLEEPVVEKFVPARCCCPVDVRVVPMTPVWCILRNLVGYGGGR